VLQCVAVCCSVLQCVAVCCSVLQDVTLKCLVDAELLGFNTLQHSATLCNTLDMRLICTLSHNPIPYSTGRDVEVRVIYRAVWVQHTTTRCNTLQHATDSCIAHFSTQPTHVGRDVKVCGVRRAARLQHAATPCNALQHATDAHTLTHPDTSYSRRT